MLRLIPAGRGFNYDWYSLVNLYKKHTDSGASVLEIGASRPERTRELGLYCRDITGVEISPERIPCGAGNIRYLMADWQDLSRVIDPGSIDVAVASHVIEHVGDDLKAINELFCVLKPGGVALLNTPNRRRLTRRVIEFFTGPRRFPHWEHQREYTEADLVSLFEKSFFRKWRINGLVLGLHGGPVHVYFEKVPRILHGASNYWEIELFK